MYSQSNCTCVEQQQLQPSCSEFLESIACPKDHTWGGLQICSILFVPGSVELLAQSSCESKVAAAKLIVHLFSWTHSWDKLLIDVCLSRKAYHYWYMCSKIWAAWYNQPCPLCATFCFQRHHEHTTFGHQSSRKKSGQCATESWYCSMFQACFAHNVHITWRDNAEHAGNFSMMFLDAAERIFSHKADNRVNVGVFSSC